MTAALVPVEAIKAESAPWTDKANRLVVTGDRAYQVGAEMLQGIKALRIEIAAACDPVIKAAHAAHKAATKQKNDLEAELVEADRVIREKLAAYHEAQERIAAQARIAAEAEHRAAQEAADREAAQLAAAGESELAELARAEAAIPVPAPKAHTVAAAGVSTRETWDAEVTDMPAFLRGVIDGKIPRGAVLVNATLLRQMARSLKDELDWPGVTVKRGASVVVR